MQIDPNSVVTQEMVTKLAELQGVNEDVALGTLSMWERGQGELDAQIVDREETAPIFKAVRDAYFAKHGVEDAALLLRRSLAAAEAEEASGKLHLPQRPNSH